MFELSPYSLAIFTHACSAIVLVGSSLSAPLIRTAIHEARSVAELKMWLAFSRRSARWNPAASLVLLATGLYLGSYAWWGAGWFYLAVAAWAANVVIVRSIVVPSAVALAAATFAAEGTEIPPAVHRLRRGRVPAMAERAMLANDLAMLYVMFAKPAGEVAVVLVLVAQLVALGRGLYLRAHPVSAGGHGRPGSAVAA